jgi:hypothetical protein
MRCARIPSERFVIRPVAAASLAALLLSACSQGGHSASDASDPYAGLNPEILSWRTEIEASHPACKTKVEGKGCESFSVTCKAAQTITPDETAKGVTAKLVAAMTFNGRNPDGSSGAPGSSFATFSKVGGKWSRSEAKPVNMSSCAPL